MLKSLAIAAALSLIPFGAAQAQQPPRSPAEVSLAFERHFNAADLDGLAGLYRQGGIFVAAPGVQLQDPARIRAALTQFMAPRVPIRLTVHQVYEAGDTALIVFGWVLKGTGADGKPVDMAGTGADVVTRQSNGTWAYAIDNPFGVTLPAR
ncbi:MULTISPECIES: YybH family protein [Cupriavidus]